MKAAILCLLLAGCCTTKTAPPPRIIDNTCVGAPDPTGAASSADTAPTKRWILGYAAWYNQTCRKPK